MRCRCVDSLRVLCPIFVEDSITFIVETFTNQPLEDVGGISRIKDAARRIHPVEGRDVVPRNSSPMSSSCSFFDPTLDSCECSLNPRPVAEYSKVNASLGAFAFRPNPFVTFGDKKRNKLLAAR